MTIEPAYLLDFKREQSNLADFYPAYRENLEDRLWYAEAHTGSRLASLLRLKVIARNEYWGNGNPSIPAIRNNVLQHVQKASSGAEPLRLVEQNEDDKAWRMRDPDFLQQIENRYGSALTKYKIDQTVSVVGIDDEFFTVQRSSYLDQFGSNIFCDEEQIDGSTLRKKNVRDGKLLSFEESTLANTIGVAALFFDRNGIPILRWRKHEDPIRRMAVMREGWHCTSSGVLTWQDFVKDQNMSVSSVVNGIVRETENEAGLFADTDKVDGKPMFNIKIVAFARELKRAGKPQFFFRIDFPYHTADQIVDEIIRRPKIEGDEFGGKKRHTLMGRIFGIKTAEKKSDFLVDEKLALKNIDRASLQLKSGGQNGINFTFESYANLYYCLER
jgi:hypothetical protein